MVAITPKPGATAVEVRQSVCVTGDPTDSIGKLLKDYLNAAISSRQATLTRPLGLYPSDTVALTNATERNTGSTSYVKLKEITMGFTCAFRTYFESKTNNAGNPDYEKVYKNGVAFGTERSNNTTTYVAYTEDLSFAGGDLYQIYGKAPGGNVTYVQNQKVNGTEGLGVATSGY